MALHPVARCFILFAQMFPIFLYTSHCLSHSALGIVRVSYKHSRLLVALKIKKISKKIFREIIEPDQIWGVHTDHPLRNGIHNVFGP